MIPEDIVRVNFHYVLGAVGSAPVEEANWGFHLQFVDDISAPGAGIDWSEATAALAGDMADSHATLWASIKSMFPKDVLPTQVKATHLDTNRHALDIATDTLTGGRGTADVPLPYEVSTCVSMYGYDPGSFVSDRARKRGRFYLPPMSNGTMDAGGIIGSTYVNDLSVALDTFFEDVQGKRVVFGSPATDAGYWRVVVVSGIGAGMATQVEALGIGRIPDAQRRRRRSQLETPRVFSTLSHA